MDSHPQVLLVRGRAAGEGGEIPVGARVPCHKRACQWLVPCPRHPLHAPPITACCYPFSAPSASLWLDPEVVSEWTRETPDREIARETPNKQHYFCPPKLGMYLPCALRILRVLPLRDLIRGSVVWKAGGQSALWKVQAACSP